MKYLRIQNDGVCPIDGFILLGVSTARGNSDSIGQFGSGAKLGVITALRRGFDPIVFCDTTRIKFWFESKKAEWGNDSVSYDQMFYQVSNRKPVASQLTLDFGALDWTSSFMVFREFVANALDSVDMDTSKVKVDIVNSATPRPDKTVVYLPIKTLKQEQEVESYLGTLGTQFRHFDPKADLDAKIIIKDEPSDLKIYRKNVLVKVGDETDAPSVFDYNMGDELRIDEARNLNTGSCEEHCIKEFVSREDYLRKLFPIVCNPTQEVWEKTVSDYNLRYHASFHRELWQRVWEELYDNAVIASASQALLIPYAIDRGFRAITIECSSWYNAMVRAGIPTVSDAVDDINNRGHEITKPHRAVADMAVKVWDWIKTVDMDNDNAMPIVNGFNEMLKKDSDNPVIAYCDMDGEVMFNNDWPKDEPLDRAMLEELLHHTTGRQDLTRGFQTDALELATRAFRLIDS